MLEICDGLQKYEIEKTFKTQVYCHREVHGLIQLLKGVRKFLWVSFLEAEVKGQRTVAGATQCPLGVIRLVFRNRTSLKQNWEKSPLWVQPKTSVYCLIWENGSSLMTVWAFCLVWLWFLFFFNQNHKLAQLTYSFNRNEKSVCVCVCVCVCVLVAQSCPTLQSHLL